MKTTNAEIATMAARLVVEDGMEYGQAKRRTVRQLGLPARTPLPDSMEMEDAVREYIALFRAETQGNELKALRRLALRWMERMEQFRPHLSGAVWNGTATKNSDIYLQLFCDDEKSAQIALMNAGISHEAHHTMGFRGKEVGVLTVSDCVEDWDRPVYVHMLIYDVLDLRGALRPDAHGRRHRGNLESVRKMIDEV